MDAVVELRSGEPRGSLASSVLWVLDRRRPEGAPILLAQLAGGGLRRMEADAEHGLYAELASSEPASPLIDRIAGLVLSKSETPLLSSLIAPADALVSDACDLRYSSYERTVDMAGHLERDAGRFNELRAGLDQDYRELEQEIADFRRALDTLDTLGGA